MSKKKDRIRGDSNTSLSENMVKKLDQKNRSKFKDQKALKFKHDEKKGPLFAIDIDAWKTNASKCFGTEDEDLQNHFIYQIAKTTPGISLENCVEHLNKLIPIMRGLNPQDELEGMLACQMVGVHNLAMEVMRRAMLKDQTFDRVSENVNRATKLMRTFTAQMEVLNRYRGKGQQKMTVEHVHVHQGGQAIVGNVEKGGGVKNEK